MTRKQRRLTLIGLAGIVLAVAAGLILYAMSDRIVFFNAPSDLAAHPSPPGTRLRLGGLVATGSVVKHDDGTVNFAVTDGDATVPVSYRGILPDLFREGQGVVAEGLVGADGGFTADTVLAKHDEKYMPREVVDALKARGVWEDGSGTATAAGTATAGAASAGTAQ
jgi:cytochrome c-type biogenesis protein CcmE